MTDYDDIDPWADVMPTPVVPHAKAWASIAFIVDYTERRQQVAATRVLRSLTYYRDPRGVVTFTFADR